MRFSGSVLEHASNIRKQDMRFLILLAVFTLSFPLAAQAEQLKIAVVDVEKILNISKAGKSIQQQLRERREGYQKEFSKLEKDLNASEKKLLKAKPDLSVEAFAAKRKEFQTQLLETRKLFQKRRNSLDKGLGTAMSTLRKNIIQVTAEVADEGGYNMILTRDSVVIVEKSMEITKQVLERLDSKVSSIKLDVEK